MKLRCILRFHVWELLWIFPQDQPMITCTHCNAGKFIGKPRVNYWLKEIAK